MKTKLVLLMLSVLFLVGCGMGGRQQQEMKVEVMEERSRISSMYASADPSDIVLMLPLKGRYAANSRAIRNGFLASYDHARKKDPDISIKVIDTTNKDIEILYREAVEGGAEVIVGPLTKKELGIMVEMDSLPVPVIALNTLDDYTSNFKSNLYQFGLLPQDEATQVADKMVSMQYDQAAIIFPDNVWGEKIAEAFKDRYEFAGGEVVAVLSYNSAANLPEQVCYFLAQDASELCVRKERRRSKDDEEKKEPDSSETMRRQDINTIFLVANTKDARQLIPLLKFYYAGDLPIYSISSIYAGTRAPNLDRDLDGVHFCDMPWVLKNPNSLDQDLQSVRKKIISLWRDSFSSYSKFYALGIDAYDLATGLNSFLHSAQYGFDGATGRLYLDDFNHIYRQLSWARMRGGVPILVK